MKPEEQARANIDRQLEAAGWLVQDHKKMNLAAGRAIAVREFALETGPVDYLLYVLRQSILKAAFEGEAGAAGSEGRAGE